MTFYFYDLETSGINPRTSRTMQFAGQRTDMDLNPIGEPDNILIKMTHDVLPDPDAILITGITPQQTHLEGISEAEFLKYFTKEIATGNTIFIGFNNIRFDDEFIRFMLWRNFYDSYEWQWKDGCSRWDLLDAVRMTRALRPEGIKWPYGPDGKPSNRLELISSINELLHESSHDALSDVKATIAVAKLIRQKQPKLFEYLLGLRNKTTVEALVTNGQPLVYTSGRYASEHEKTTVAAMVSNPISRPGALMYDLRINPEPLLKMSAGELAGLWQTSAKDEPVFPVKLLSYNKSPAIAPLNVLDPESQKRLGLDMQVIGKNLKTLQSNAGFSKKLSEAFEMTTPKDQSALIFDELTVDTKLYDGFVSDADKIKMSAVRAAEPAELTADNFEFSDERLKLLLPLYKARNFPKYLSDQERVWWEAFRSKKLVDGGENSFAAKYFNRINEISASKIDYEKRYLLEELNLYGQSILPADEI
jgi:exodeoxyribonuclease I